MAKMSAAEFEARYVADPDPWGYTTSPYEREKYAATLAAAGLARSAARWSSAGSIGVFSQALAPRCDSLITLDAAPTAVSAARTRLAGHPGVNVILGAIPADIPRRPYDLVVASEILYYLLPSELAATLVVLRRLLIAGGRLVAVHWRPDGPERPFSAEQVHARLRGESWLMAAESEDAEEYLLDALERR